MIFWDTPPIIKVYEALGAIADKRILIEGNTAKVYSSSGNKFYTVTYDSSTRAIMCNDNGSYWQGYLGYPALSFLMTINVIPYTPSLAKLLEDIPWKDINTKFKNDWDKTQSYCHDLVTDRKGDLSALISEITRIHEFISNNPFHVYGKKSKPPSGY
jgi:hypothetical protein